jgi:hypothetical protein
MPFFSSFQVRETILKKFLLTPSNFLVGRNTAAKVSILLLFIHDTINKVGHKIALIR